MINFNPNNLEMILLHIKEGFNFVHGSPPLMLLYLKTKKTLNKLLKIIFVEEIWLSFNPNILEISPDQHILHIKGVLGATMLFFIRFTKYSKPFGPWDASGMNLMWNY